MSIDLTQLPAPKVVEALDFETLFAQHKAQLLALVPADQRAAIAATLELESEPLTLHLQLCSYRELLLRQRVNEAAKATMLAYAEGTDLDNKAADYDVTRLLITPANPDTELPTDAVWESDTRLRLRCQMAPEGLSVAGSRGAYLFHTLSASAQVLDADVETVAGGVVRVWLLDARGDGIADAALCATVAQALDPEDVRPMCDTVEVLPSQPRPFRIDAVIEWQDGGEALSGGLVAARKRIATLLTARRKIKGSVPRSAIDAALHVAGVERVILLEPAQDVICGTGVFPDCRAVELA